MNQIKLLVDFPYSGRKVPEFKQDDIREIIVYSRAIYQVSDKQIVIAAVVQGKRILQ